MNNTACRFICAMVVSTYMAVGAACDNGPITCEECLTEQHATLNPETCWPYCEGEPEPMPDADGDGVADVDDLCPSSTEVFNGFEDADGCADTAPSAIIPQTLGGQWTGGNALTVFRGGTVVRQHTMTVAVSGDGQSGTISGFCPDGSGNVALKPLANGGGEWTGIYACYPGSWGQCPQTNMMLFSIRITHSGTGALIETRGTVYMTDNDDATQTACDVSGEHATSMLAAP